MTVTLLGNPVREDRVSFLLIGAGSAPLQLQLTTLQGRVLDQQQGRVHRPRISINSP